MIDQTAADSALDMQASIFGLSRRNGETDESLRRRLNRVMTRGNRGASLHDIAAGVFEAVPGAICVGAEEYNTRHEPVWWRRWFLREKACIELRARFTIIVMRSGRAIESQRLLASRALQQLKPAGVLATVDVIEQAGSL